MGRNPAKPDFNPITVNDLMDELVNKPIIQPAIRGGEVLTKTQNNLNNGRPFGEGVDARQFAADTAQTGINFATAGQAPRIVAAGKALPKIIHGAKVGAAYGGADGAVETFRDPNATAQDYGRNVAQGAAIGGVVGGAIPGGIAVGKAGVDATKEVAGAVKRDIDLGLPTLNNQAGYIATPDSVNFNKYQAQGKPVVEFNDGLKGVEISDKKMKAKPQGVQQLLQGRDTLLDDVLDHKQQKADYPVLYSREGTGMVKVRLDYGDNTTRGSFSTDDGIITINPAVLGNTPERVAKTLQSEQGRRILAHEISHAIDNYSGVKGSNPFDVQNALRMEQGRVPTEMDVYQAYNQTPSEQRALIQEDRTNMSQRQIDRNPIVTRASLEAKASGGEVAAMRYNPQPKGKDGKFVKSAEKVYRVHALDDVDAERMAFLKSKGYSFIADGSRTIDLISGKEVRAVKKLDNLNPTGGLHVKYDPQSRMKMPLGDNITTLDKTMGKSPDEMITVYRGAPKNQKTINPGDFITTNKELAKSYTGDGNVIESKVPLKHILDDKTEPLGEEYLYRPSKSKPIAAMKKPNVANGSLYDPPPTAKKQGTQPPKFTKVKPTTIDPTLVKNDVGDFAREEQVLNANRLDLDNSQRAEVMQMTVKDVKEKLTFKQIQEVAKSAGIDTRTHSIDQQAEKIAGQLNARRAVVDAENKYTQLKKSGAKPAEVESAFLNTMKVAVASTEQGSEAARALGARRVIANELDTPMQHVIRLLNDAGVNPEVAAKKAVDVDWTDGRSVIRFYRDLVPARFDDKLDLVRYNSMLSSPSTQLVNIFSTGTHIATAPIHKEVTAILDHAKSLLTGSKRQYAHGEGAAFVKGGAASIGEAVRDFRATLKGLDEFSEHANAGINIKDGRMPVKAVGDSVTVDVLSLPMRILASFDAANKAIVRGGTNASMKSRAKAGIKLPTDKSAVANEEAAYWTFNRELGDKSQGNLFRGIDEITQKVMQLRNSKNVAVRLPAKFTLPFVRIGVNLLKTGTEFSPLGVASIPGAQRKTEQMAKVVMGTATFGMGASLLGQDRLTWAEPTNPKEKAAFKEAGMQPYSVKFGDQWVQISKLPPILAFNMAFISGIDDARKTAKLTDDQVELAVTSFAKYGNFLADQSYFKQMGDALAASKGDPEAITRLVGNWPSQLVPGRALGGWIAQLTDESQRKIDTDKKGMAAFFDKQVQNLMLNVPGLREQVPERTGITGNVIPSNRPVKVGGMELPQNVVNALSPVKISRENTPVKGLYDQMALEKKEERDKREAKKDPNKPDFKTRQVGQSKADAERKPTKSPKEKFEDALKDYNEKRSTMSTPERFKKEKELRTLNITKDYEKDVIDMHSMSKGDLAGLFASNPDLRKYEGKVLELDEKLANLKGTKPKFGGTLAYKAKGRKGGSRGRGKGGKSKLPSYKPFISSTAGMNKLLKNVKVKNVSAPKTSKPKLAKNKKIKVKAKIA